MDCDILYVQKTPGERYKTRSRVFYLIVTDIPSTTVQRDVRIFTTTTN